MAAKGIRAGRAYVEIFADATALQRGLSKAQAKLRAFSASVGNVGRSLVKTSAAMLIPLGIATKTFAAYEDQMAIVKAVTGATTEEFKKMEDVVEKLGRTTSFTASEVAEGMTSLGRAGFNATQAIAAIPGVLNLARSTATELGTAAEIAAGAVRGFGLDLTETGRVADILSVTANGSAQTLEILGEAFSKAAPIARRAGESIENTAAILGVLANATIKGAEAGTALRNAYLQIADPAVQQLLRKRNIEVLDGNKNLRKLSDILSDVNSEISELGTGEQLQLLQAVFGKRTVSAAGAAASSLAEFSKFQKVVGESSGKAAKVAREMDNTVGGSFRLLTSAVEGVQIAIGKALAPTLRKIMGLFERWSGLVSEFIDQNNDMVVLFLKVALGIGAVGAALLTIATAAAAASLVLGALSTAVGFIVGTFALLKVALLAILSPFGLVIVALGALLAAVLEYSGAGAAALKWLGEKWGQLSDRVMSVVKQMKTALSAGGLKAAAEILWLQLRILWLQGTSYLNELFEIVYVTAADVFDRIRTSAVVTWAAITKAVTVAAETWYQAILAVAEGISVAFWTSIRGVVDAFAWLADKVVNAGYELHLIDEGEVAAGKKFVDDLRKGTTEFTAAQKNLAKNLYGGEAADSAKKIRDAETEFNQKRSSEEQQLLNRNAQRDQEYIKDLNAAKVALQKAQQDAAKANSENEAKIAAEKEKGNEKAGDTLAARIKAALTGAGSAVAEAGKEQSRGLSAKFSFREQLGGLGSTEEQTRLQTEMVELLGDIDENTVNSTATYGK